MRTPVLLATVRRVFEKLRLLSSLTICSSLAYLLLLPSQTQAGCWREFGVKVCNWESFDEDIKPVERFVKKEVVDPLRLTIESLTGSCADSHLDRKERLLVSPNVDKVTAEGVADSETNVYFVNGVGKTSYGARQNAKALSKVMNKPVGLIYNPSIKTGNTGTPSIVLAAVEAAADEIIPISPYISEFLDDFKEALYDRAWPELFPNGCKTQFNPTTKQVTGLLYDAAEKASGPITIVSHSQGDLIVRNGILGAMHLGKAGWIKQNLTWIITAPPLTDGEINQAVYKESVSILHPNDCVALFKDWSNGTCDASFGKHDFTETYIPKIAEYRRTAIEAANTEDFPIEERFRAVDGWAGANCYAGAFPSFEQADYGSGIVDGTILLRGIAVEHRDVPAADLGNLGSLEDRFRAVDIWAGLNGYGGAFPTFHQADYGNGVVHGVKLLKKEWTRHQDIPVAELGNPQTPEERIRAVHRWANEHGYLSGFPTFQQADYGTGVVYGTILIKPSAARYRDISRPELKSEASFAFNGGNGCTEEISTIYQQVYDRDPSSTERDNALNQARSGFSYTVVKSAIISQAIIDSLQFYRGFYGREPSDNIRTQVRTYFDGGDSYEVVKVRIGLSFEQRFRAVDNWGGPNCSAGAFPNFEQADYGSGIVDGTILLRDMVLDHRDIPVAELGFPSSLEERFRAVNIWAGRNGYAGAFPTFQQADYGEGTVYGVKQLKKEWATHRDIPVVELGNPSSPEERIRAIGRWAGSHGYFAGFPTFHQADYGNGVVYGAILIKYEAARHRDILRQELRFGSPFSFNSGGGCTEEILALYQNVYGRGPSSVELANAIAEASSGFSYTAVKSKMTTQAIYDIYKSLYHREPTQTELAKARDDFAIGLTYAEVWAKVEDERKKRAVQFLLDQYVRTGFSRSN